MKVIRICIVLLILFVCACFVFLVLPDNHQQEEQAAECETVALSYEASTEDFKRSIINHVSHSSKNFSLVWKGSSVPIKFVLHEVMCADPVKEAGRIRLHHESLKDGDIAQHKGWEVFRIYLYKDKIIAQNKHMSKDGLYQEMIKFQKNNPDFCVLVSFEEVILLKEIWGMLANVYEYSHSRVVIGPSVKELDYFKNSGDIR